MKYELGQTIYFMLNNRLHSAPVQCRMKVENQHEDWACTNEQRSLFVAFGPAGVFYNTCHGVIKEEDAHASKEDLAKALIG